MRKLKRKCAGVLEKGIVNVKPEDKLFEEVKVNMVMKLCGISHDEALGIVGENNKKPKHQPSIEKGKNDENLLLPPEKFFPL